MSHRDSIEKPVVVGSGHCPACGARDSFVITASQEGDLLTVRGSCTVCGHDREGSSLLTEDEEFLEDARAYYTAFLIRSFYLGDNEELYECPYCDGFYIVRTIESRGMLALVGECEDCHYSRTAIVSGKHEKQEALDWLLDNLEEETEENMPENESEPDDYPL